MTLSQDLMTSSNGNIFRVTGPLCGEFTGPGEFPTQRPVTRSLDVFFDLRLNKWLSKQPWGWWFETLLWALWRRCNDFRLLGVRFSLKAALPLVDRITAVLYRCNNAGLCVQRANAFKFNEITEFSCSTFHKMYKINTRYCCILFFFFGNDVNDTWTRVFYLPIFFRVTSSCQWSNMQIRWESMWLVKYVNQLYFPSLNVKWLWKVFLYFWAISKELLFRLFMYILHIVKHVPVDKFSGVGGWVGGVH